MAWVPPPLPPHFSAALRDVRARKVEARIAAATRLGSAELDERTEAVVGLSTLAGDPHPHVRAASMRALAELNEPAAGPVLRDRLVDEDPLVRELALIALGGSGSALGHSAVRAATRSPHPELRFQAIACLAERADPADLALAADLLRDVDGKVRAHAARHLVSYGADALPALRGALGDDEGAVRSEAAVALARLGDGSGAAALPTALEDPELVLDALEAIAELKLSQLREPTAALAQSVLRPLLWKAAAARALIRLDDPRGVPVLSRVLRAFRSHARSYAVRVVGELGVDELTGELVRLTRRFRGTDPEVLVEALARLLPRNGDARGGLERLARRNDRAGAEARRALGATVS